MPSQDKLIEKSKLTAETFALCLMLASSLQIVENLVPKIPIFPWLRFGLTHLVLLPFLLRYGSVNALMLFMFRNIIALMYGSQIFSSFLISSVSGTASIIIFGSISFFLYHGRILGLLGISILLAGTFNIIQLLAVNLFFIQHINFFFQLTPLLVWSLLSGAIIAFLISRSSESLKYLLQPREISFTNSPKTTGLLLELKNWKSAIPALFLIISLFIINTIYFQLAVFFTALILSRLKNLKLFLYAWPFFFYLAWMHLFSSSGIYILGDWVTREGLAAFIFLSLRTSSLILLGQLLVPLVTGMQNLFSGSVYMRGFAIAIPLLPALYGIAISQAKSFFISIKNRQFSSLLNPLIERLNKEIH